MAFICGIILLNSSVENSFNFIMNSHYLESLPLSSTHFTFIGSAYKDLSYYKKYVFNIILIFLICVCIFITNRKEKAPPSLVIMECFETKKRNQLVLHAHSVTR